VDAWPWAVRLYKTRSTATAAGRGGHVRVNRRAAKASTPVKVGDRIAGTGRPAKRERRDLDRLRRP
jgi:ribosomal 50S subunit-recycling heat shock protein